MAVASDGGLRTVAARRSTPRPVTALRTALAASLPPLVLVGFVVAVFFGELGGGPLAYGRDTTSFYYPLTSWAAAELQAGRLPLWTPTIFGGYPIVSDGELGLLSPIQASLLLTLDTPIAYAWMRVIHYLAAGLGLFLYARLLGASSLGAAIGGLAFAFSSFMVGHLQHDNILRSAVWLPWLLLAAEQALRTTGAARAAWTAGGALVLALQGLGVHVQPVLMSLIALGLAVLFGPLGKASVPSGIRPGISRAAALGRLFYNVRATLTRRRLAGLTGDWLPSRFRLVLTVVGLGLGLAAVQLVPLYQLGLRSLRPSLSSYTYATSFAISPPQLLTLFFPAMFNFDAERHWALWATHETTLYVGIAPLLLAIVALACVRGRAVAFFGLLALVSLVLTFGDYLPIKPYAVVWGLPGFGYLRAPARFSLLFSFAVAVLAALGVTWLGIRARHPGRSGPLTSTLTGLFFIPLVLALAIAAVRWWLRFDPARATDLLALAIQTSRENPQLGPWHVYYGLLEFTRPDNPRTALGLGLLVAVPVLARLWVARPRLEAVWSCLLLALTVADLWIFVTRFYPTANPRDLTPSGPAISFLASQPRPFRIFVEPALNPRFGANQLATLGIETVNGYSSLEPPRFSDYWWSVVEQDNVLLDLFDVRYVLAARQAAGARTFEGTSYYPSDRLMSGAAANPSGLETYRVRQTRVTSIVLVGAVEGLGEVPAGTSVAEITLIGPDGARQAVPVRGGTDIAEYLAPDPGYPIADYVGPRVVWAGPLFAPDSIGPEQPVRLYGSVLPLSQPFETVTVEVRMLAPAGRLHVDGLGLRAPDNSVLSVRAIDKAKYRMLDSDQTSFLLENTEARPRVSVVGEAIPANGPTTAARLLELRWDPRRQVVVEGMPAADVHGVSPDAPATPDGSVGTASLLEYTPTRIVAQVEMAAPGYLVLADRYDDGWQAAVDDADATIARANGIERAVAVPAGSHLVSFTYRPFPLLLGLGVTVVAALIWLGLLGLALVRAILRRRR